MHNTKHRYFFVAGGKTGGHIFPGLALAYQIIKLNPNLVPIFIGVKEGIEHKIIPQTGFKLLFTNVSGFYGKSIWQKLKCLATLNFAVFKALYYVIKFRPAFVIGLGGYVSFPACVACVVLRKPLFMLEQNQSLGIVSRTLGVFAKRLFLPVADKKLAKKNVRFLGTPIRQEIADLAKDKILIWPKGKLNLLVFGGSQGSSKINQVFMDSLSLIKKAKLNLHITHQCGYSELSKVTKHYQDLKMPSYEVKAFIDDMAKAYKKSDVVICRGGSAIFELAAAAKLLILIPITYSSGNHQLKNCKFLVDKNAAFAIFEKDLNANKLFEKIKYAYLNPAKMFLMRKNLRAAFKSEASLNIAKECLANI